MKKKKKKVYAITKVQERIEIDHFENLRAALQLAIEKSIKANPETLQKNEDEEKNDNH